MENRRNSFEFEDLLACGRGEMFAEGPQLPLPPMLMFDRISELAEAGGEYGKGLVRATLEVNGEIVLALKDKTAPFAMLGDWVWHDRTLQPLGLPPALADV